MLIFVLVLGPFTAYFSYTFMKMDFFTVMQLFSYIGVALLLIFRNSINPIRFPRYLLFYLLFVVYIFYADLYRLDREFKVKYLFDNYLIGGFNFMLIIENLKFSKKHFRLMLDISKKILIIAFIVIVIQQVYNPNFFVRPDLTEALFTERGSSESRLISIYSFMGVMSAGLGFVPLFILVVEYLDKRNKKILIWLVLGLLFAILTKARWVMLNTLLVFFVLLIGHKDKIKRVLKYFLVFPVFLILFSLALNTTGVNVTGIVEDRILEKDKDISDKSAGTRLLAFTIFKKFFWDHPLFGAGNIKYGMGGTGENEYKLRRALNKKSSQLHVGYLSLLYRYGLIGGVLFIGFLYLMLRKLYKDSKRTTYWAPFLGVLGFVLANFTLVYFSFYQMGLLLVLLANKYYLEENKTHKLLRYAQGN